MHVFVVVVVVVVVVSMLILHKLLHYFTPTMLLAQLIKSYSTIYGSSPHMAQQIFSVILTIHSGAERLWTDDKTTFRFY